MQMHSTAIAEFPEHEEKIEKNTLKICNRNTTFKVDEKGHRIQKS
jgi:hypothetical protein